MIITNTRKTRNYFSRQAGGWDAGHNDRTYRSIRYILKRLNPVSGDCILDVACGTGILAPYLSDYAYTATDISPKMCKMFKNLFSGKKIVTCDYQEKKFPRSSFNIIIIFNAFPHFEFPAKVFKNSFHYLKPGGRLCICHSMNRRQLDQHHLKAGIEVAGHVLVSDSEFMRMYKEAGFKKITVDNGIYFYSSGQKPAMNANAKANLNTLQQSVKISK